MTEREHKATCNFTPSADGFGDYFVRKRKQMEKVKIELFGRNGLTESPISAVKKNKKAKNFLDFSPIHQTT